MAKTSDVYKAQPNKRVSNMVKAMQGWNEALGKVETKSPQGKFNRVVKVDSGDVHIDGAQLDVEFSVPFDDDTEPNEAEITVYNLAKTTLSNLEQNAKITITAGYKDDTGVVFAGYISKVSTKWSGLDKVTTIYALDNSNSNEKEVESTAFAKGTKASIILKALVEKLGLPIAEFSITRDHIYSDGVTVDGEVMANVEKYAKVCGASAYINKGKVYVQSLSEGEDIGFSVNVDTGLLDSPEEFTEEETNENYVDTVRGVKLKMLLEHRITTAVYVTLKSKNYSGKYRVREGKHVCTETDFYTEITCIGESSWSEKEESKKAKLVTLS